MGKRLTQKTCLLLTILSLAVCLFAYGCIWFFLPQVDRRRAQKGLKEQAEQLVSELRVIEKHEGEYDLHYRKRFLRNGRSGLPD